MQKIFSCDSPLIQMLNRVTDFMLVNLLYLLCCIPLITIGAARTALYHVSFLWEENEDAGAKAYLLAFVRNFRQSFIPWCCVVLSGCVLTYCALLTYVHQIPGSFLFWIALVLLLILYGLILSQLFGFCAKFNCTLHQYLQNALLLGLAHPLVSLIHIALAVLPWAMLVLWPETFLHLVPLWLLAYFSAQGRIHAKLAKPIYDRVWASHVEAQDQNGGMEPCSQNRR